MNGQTPRTECGNDGGDDRGTPEQRGAMRSAILNQCFGVVALLALENGLLLVYFKALGMSAVNIVICLAMPHVFIALLGVPSAFLADRFGKKAVGLTGALLQPVGFLLFVALPWVPGAWVHVWAYAGSAIFGAGAGVFTASWFALLSPAVPIGYRGRFFSKLRVSWQFVALLFTLVCVKYLTQDTPVGTLQILLAVNVAGLLARIYFYWRIPEMEKPDRQGDSFWQALRSTLTTPGYVSFISYIFLLALFTMGCPIIFGLIEKNFLGFGDDIVVLMGLLHMVGGVFGFWVVGRAIDRSGTRLVFTLCHFGYAAVILLYLVRGLFGTPVVYAVAPLRFLFGFIFACASCAISTELLALIPPRNKSMSTTLCTTLLRAGRALSGLLAGWVLDLGFIRETWTLWGLDLSDYDALLLVYGVMVTLLVVTLGLVPSVMGGALRRDRAG